MNYKKSSKINKTNRVKETAEGWEVSPASARVTVSLNPSLLKSVDTYANHNNLSRSVIFERALLLWQEALQEEADKEFYGEESKDPQTASWNKVTSKATRYLWND